MAARGCPICARPPVEQYRPFCSKRCQAVDLARWLGEAYRIPAEEDEADLPADGEDQPPRAGR